MSADAVVLGAGSSARMGGPDKLLADLEGEPVIVCSLRAFEASPGIRSVVVTTSGDNEANIREAVEQAGLAKVRAFVRGGASRAESVLHGLRALDGDLCKTPFVLEDPAALAPSPRRPLGNPRDGGAVSIPSRSRHSSPLQGERQIPTSSAEIGEGSSGLDPRVTQRAIDCEPPDYVAVHDGARPLVTPALIEDGLRMARVYGAAVAGVPATDTLKIVDRDRLVVRTPIRSSVWHAQTPQFARFADLLGAHERQTAMLDLYTDDVSVLEAEGLPVRVFEGSRENLKITTPDDLVTAARILRQRRTAASG